MTAGATALSVLGDRLSSFEDTLRDVMAPEASQLDKESQKMCDAVRHAQQLEAWMSDDELAKLIRLFESNSGAAAAYVLLEHEGLQMAWIRDHLGLY